MTCNGVLFAVFLLLAACAVAPERAGWPADMPPRSWYVSVYNADARNRESQSLQKYLKWVKVFYNGWGGVRGWRSVQEEILADADPADREGLRRWLEELGRKISGEWAKSYGARAINGQTVQVWVNAAYECSARRDHERLIRAIDRDVDALLAGRLDRSAITLERYYPDAERPPLFEDYDGGE